MGKKEKEVQMRLEHWFTKKWGENLEHLFFSFHEDEGGTRMISAKMAAIVAKNEIEKKLGVAISSIEDLERPFTNGEGECSVTLDMEVRAPRLVRDSRRFGKKFDESKSLIRIENHKRGKNLRFQLGEKEIIDLLTSKLFKVNLFLF